MQTFTHWLPSQTSAKRCHMRDAVKLIVALAAAVSLLGEASVQGQSGFQCFYQGYCYQLNNCTCYNGGTMYISACNSSQGLVYSCPYGGAGECDWDPCPLPSCQPNGTFCNTGSECCSGLCGVESMLCGSSSPILIDLERNTRNLDLMT
jgi:hypothetical protein